MFIGMPVLFGIKVGFHDEHMLIYPNNVNIQMTRMANLQHFLYIGLTGLNGQKRSIRD
jgi:hypothetical protein